MKQRLSKQRIRREKGFLYYVDKQGDVSRVAMKNSGKRGRGKVLKLGINKEPGWLYFVDNGGYVARVKMMRGRKKAKKKTAKKKVMRRRRK